MDWILKAAPFLLVCDSILRRNGHIFIVRFLGGGEMREVISAIFDGKGGERRNLQVAASAGIVSTTANNQLFPRMPQWVTLHHHMPSLPREFWGSKWCPSVSVHWEDSFCCHHKTDDCGKRRKPGKQGKSVLLPLLLPRTTTTILAVSSPLVLLGICIHFLLPLCYLHFLKWSEQNETKHLGYEHTCAIEWHCASLISPVLFSILFLMVPSILFTFFEFDSCNALSCFQCFRQRWLKVLFPEQYQLI